MGVERSSFQGEEKPERPVVNTVTYPLSDDPELQAIIMAGENIERGKREVDHSNGRIAKELMRRAQYGGLEQSVANLLIVAASRLAKNDIDLESWKKFVPEVEVDRWKLIDQQNLGGVMRRFVIWREAVGEGREKWDAEAVDILYITASGHLAERQVVPSHQVREFVGQTRAFTNSRGVGACWPLNY